MPRAETIFKRATLGFVSPGLDKWSLKICDNGPFIKRILCWTFSMVWDTGPYKMTGYCCADIFIIFYSNISGDGWNRNWDPLNTRSQSTDDGSTANSRNDVEINIHQTISIIGSQCMYAQCMFNAFEFFTLCSPAQQPLYTFGHSFSV
jgi:hypothetical protein